MTFRALFITAIVVVLLVFYISLTSDAISLLDCTPQPTCLGQFSESMASALAVIGGLVSAVVIAELALATPNKPPFSRILGDPAPPAKLTLLRVVTLLYLVAWFGVGIWVLVATWRKPDAIPALTALARSWFALAVAAGYAYFGLKPNG
jgi:hypothetical protein